MQRAVLFLAVLAMTAATVLFAKGSRGPDSSVVAARPLASAEIDASGVSAALSSTPELDAAPSAGGAALDLAPDRSVMPSSGITGRFGPAVPLDGRTAALVPVLRRNGEPVAGEVVFVAGPERGTRVAVTATELPAPVALFPGFAIVEARLADGSVCRRELLLDHNRDTTLELDFAVRGVVFVDVTDAGGVPVPNALVGLDGAPAELGRSGTFRCAVRVSGTPLLTVTAPGYVPYRMALPESAGADPKPVAVALTPGAALTVHLDDVPGARAGDPVTVSLMPSGGPMSRSAPLQTLVGWEHLTTATCPAGGSVRIEGLPQCRLEVFASHGDASIGPELVYLAEGEDAELALSLEAHEALVGRVLEDGEPVEGATVSLRYANPIRATHRLLGKHAKFARRQPIEVLPQVAQDVVTDEEGRFHLGLEPGIRRAPFVTVTSADGALSITREVDDSTGELVFDLADPRR